MVKQFLAARVKMRGTQRTFSALALSAIVVSTVVLLESSMVVFFPIRQSMRAAGASQQPNGDCTLIVPAAPLTAQGLATPYQLVATNPEDGPCHEANATQAAFVQAGVFDFDTGQIAVYNPLVIDQGTMPAVAPVIPQIPSNAVVALWFGFNGANLTLRASHNSLQEGHCVNGAENSIFGQFAYCNAPLFFGEVNQAINLGILTPPPLGTGKDGQPCPSVRDFGIVDQDQSDNVTGGYLLTNDGRIAQLTAVNQSNLVGAQPLTNGSDNGLLDAFVDPALGCTPWMAPDLANPGDMTTALPLNEIQAMVAQQAPVALVPLSDPMVLKNNTPSLIKTNTYRAGVDQPRALNNIQADPTAYCHNLKKIGAARIASDAPLTVKGATPDPATGNTLFTFLAQRYVNSYTNLNCQNLLGSPSPIATVQNNNGAAISATFNSTPINTETQTGIPNCTVNGQTVQGCNGSATVNGQTCTVTFTNNTVVFTCPQANP